MKEIISKELLSAILNLNCIPNSIIVRENKIEYSMKTSLNKRHGTSYNISNKDDYYNEIRDIHENINVYELMAKAKEWIHTNMYCDIITIDTGGSSRQKSVILTQAGILGVAIEIKNKFVTRFYGDTNISAILEACQWILDNKVKGESND